MLRTRPLDLPISMTFVRRPMVHFFHFHAVYYHYHYYRSSSNSNQSQPAGNGCCRIHQEKIGPTLIGTVLPADRGVEACKAPHAPLHH